MKKRNRKQLVRCIVAGSLILVLLLALAMGLQLCRPQEEKAAAPVYPLEPLPDFPGSPGIDVSAHQELIDWQAVADSGVEFVMVRLGYRGYESGQLHVDEYARVNLLGARAAGLKVGAYFFSQALNRQEAQEEAELALKVLKDFPLDLPLAYDWEYVSEEARTGDMDSDSLLECIDAFCTAVEGKYQPMIYFNRELSRTLLDLEQVAQYPYWYARYADTPEADFPIRMWQYTDTGHVPGIKGNVDRNWLFEE